MDASSESDEEALVVKKSRGPNAESVMKRLVKLHSVFSDIMLLFYGYTPIKSSKKKEEFQHWLNGEKTKNSMYLSI